MTRLGRRIQAVWSKRLPWLNRRRQAPDGLTTWPDNTHDTVRYFSEPGPAFESAFEPRASGTEDRRAARVRAIAFYLPQFHAFAENDAWWGAGFTEWRNVSRAMPRFRGHYQPRIPRDLGHTDLDNPNTLKAQAALARSAGIEAFCFYYYWFDAHRLMERPLDRFLANDVDQSFCLMWANENWTRRWDGRERDVLIEQRYDTAQEAAFIEDTARYMSHPRYVRTDGRPVFIIYCAQNIPDTANTLARWRSAWSERLGVEPWLVMAQTYDTRDPRLFGLDAAVEFPPHKVSKDIANTRRRRDLLDSAFDGQVREYADVVDKASCEPTPPWPLLRTVSPHWDNDARRVGHGVTFHGSLPARYERWLEHTVERAVDEPLGTDALVFINAWNEWAEGAYLEPDVHYGHACLNATRRVLLPDQRCNRASRLLLIGHDAHPNGAQMLALALARAFAERHRLAVTTLLMGTGTLLDQYRALGQTIVLDADTAERDIDAYLESQAFPMALCNTTVSGSLVKRIRHTGTRVVSLVHEMPDFIRARGLQKQASAIARYSDVIAFASDEVASRFEGVVGQMSGQVRVQAQGLYKTCEYNAVARQRIRQKLGAGDSDRVVIGVGFADNRKGFDRFVRACQTMRARHPTAVFIWLGKLSGEAERFYRQQGSERGSERGKVAGLHLEPFTDEVSDWLSAADVCYLSSREDPFPTSALEAFSVGIPVIAHSKNTGMDTLCTRFGALVDSDDPEHVANELEAITGDDNETRRDQRRAHVREHYDFNRYTDSLMSWLDPSRVSELPSSSTLDS